MTKAALHPLADRMRPASIDDILGQDHLMGINKPLYTAICKGHLHSMVLWGPPGTGKTTIARVFAQQHDAGFIALSAVLSGVKDIRSAIEAAQIRQQTTSKKTLLFVDEVHRFNKSQQDAFLPHIENGTIIFVGATTENPSFELNNALLSRIRVYLLKSLAPADIKLLIDRAIKDQENGLGSRHLSISEGALSTLAKAADGDARRALMLLEISADFVIDNEITEKVIKSILKDGSLRRFDKAGDIFYEQISALHKSVRGSNADGALYWFCRMIDGGCDPLYIARRVVRIASEDIGNADPRALQIALDAWQIQERLGSPEGELALAQAIIYLSITAKSNAVYRAYNGAMQAAKEYGSLEVPTHLCNAPTGLMKEFHYGKNYRYAHDEENAYAAGETYLPKELEHSIFYNPTDYGMEAKIKTKINQLRQWDQKRKKQPDKK